MVLTTAAEPLAGDEAPPIPRVFHWIWLGPKPFPAEHQDYVRSWALKHPRWERRIWTDGDLPALRNEAAYRSARTWAQKADVLRYEILLDVGGVYVDTDMECVRTLDDVIGGSRAFAGLERSDLIGNAIMGCIPGHPWMRAVVEALPGSLRTNWLTLDQTGPAFLTRMTNGRRDVTVFPPEVFYPHASTAVDSHAPVSARTVAIHHWSRSWAADEIGMIRPAAKQCLERILPPATTCVYVDGGIGLEWTQGRTGVPFVERDGEDHGPPSDDEQALAEVARHRRRGVSWFVILITETWWLAYYRRLAEFLRAEAEEIVEDRALIAFRLPPL